MKRRIHRSACAVLALIALSLTGAVTQCQWKHLAVEIPDLEVSEIQGLQFWQADAEGSQSLTEAGRIVFGERSFLENGSEVLEYSMVNSRSQPIDYLSPAIVLRGESENEAVTLVFFFAVWSEPAGWIRVSTFNAMGESDLSDESVFM